MHRIGVLPGRNAGLAMLRRLTTLVYFLAEQVLSAWSDVELAVGLPLSNAYDWDLSAKTLRAAGPRVGARRLAWYDIDTAFAEQMFQHCGRFIAPSGVQTVSVPRDWGWNFSDCTHWLLIPDVGLGAVV